MSNIQIRPLMFETNSSSTHSFVISEDSRTLDLRVLNEDQISSGILCARGGEFGWGYEELFSFSEKLSYLITDCLGGVDKDAVGTQSITRSNIAEFIPYGKSLKDFNALCTVLEETLGVTLQAEPDQTEEYCPFGYIDHQSVGNTEEIWASEQNLVNFLFNRNSMIILDSDG